MPNVGSQVSQLYMFSHEYLQWRIIFWIELISEAILIRD
jgi:hypothetical protein